LEKQEVETPFVEPEPACNISGGAIRGGFRGMEG